VNNYARLRDLDTLAMDNNVIPNTYSDEHGTSCQYPTPIPAQVMHRKPEQVADQNTHLINRIHPTAIIDVEELTLGVGVEIGAGTVIKCKRAVIGDFTLIGDNVTIRTPDFRLGDYSRLNAHSYAGGRKHLHIGRNGYYGRGCYFDSNGGLTLEDNTAFGAYSQVWTHCQHGDQIFGLNPRWHTERELFVRKDAWCIGRVVISNATEIGERALVLNESNVLHDIPADTTWAGNPAKDVTDKLGRQFDNVWDSGKVSALEDEIGRFKAAYPEHVSVFSTHQGIAHKMGLNDCTYFDAVTRQYNKRRTAAEVAFMRFTSGKFVPLENS
jgi:acetyltransferase-like isoleucine patch superfamily enzyme